MPAFLGNELFPNLSNPDTYATPSACVLKKTVKARCRPPIRWRWEPAADISNTLNYAIPFQEPPSERRPLRPVSKAIFAVAAAKTADRVALAQAERMAGTGATTDAIALAEPQGIRAYHSSPHDFERFDASRIGTGEGAQKYGYGLYFAENPEVSGRGGQYWRQFLSGMDPAENEAARRLQGAGWDRSTALTAAQTAESYWGKKFTGASAYGVPSDLKEYGRMRDLARAEAELLRGDKPVGPRTYEVNINARPEQMLDWDKPLAQQPVKDAVLGLHSGVREDMTGQQARDFLLARSWTNYAWNKYGRAPFANDAELSRVLADRGIPGIRYLDQGSRSGSLNPTYNHVIFPGHEHLVDIIKKYGIAGAAPAGLGALASQEQYEQ